jgi:hypothetical protein
MSISDLSKSICASDFRFRKDNLQKVADLLWPCLNVYLQGKRDDMKVENGYLTSYETGFLIILYQMSTLCRIRPEMEKFFLMRKSKLSAILNTFLTVFYKVKLLICQILQFSMIDSGYMLKQSKRKPELAKVVCVCGDSSTEHFGECPRFSATLFQVSDGDLPGQFAAAPSQISACLPQLPCSCDVLLAHFSVSCFWQKSYWFLPFFLLIRNASIILKNHRHQLFHSNLWGQQEEVAFWQSLYDNQERPF